MGDGEGLTFNETELVAQAQSGQLSAYGDLIGHYQDRLYGLAVRMTGSSDDACEVVQETFLRGLKGLGQFKRKSQFYTWLVRIMMNLVNDTRARRQRELRDISQRGEQMLRESQAAGMVDRRSDPAGLLEQRQMAQLIDDALDMIDSDQRQTFVLREFEQLSYKQIAVAMGVSEGTVKSRLFRAREAMRTILKPYFTGE